MPKVINNLRETILKSAKQELLLRGYDSLTIRSVAASCSIAVGTIYNYFPSKEILCGVILLEDWVKALEEMQRRSAEAPDVAAGLTALYTCIVAYSSIYQSVWSGYTFTAGAKAAFGKRHNMLVRQIADVIVPLLTRFSMDVSGDIDLALAEGLLLCAGESELTFDAFLPLAARMIRHK